MRWASRRISKALPREAGGSYFFEVPHSSWPRHLGALNRMGAAPPGGDRFSTSSPFGRSGRVDRTASGHFGMDGCPRLGHDAREPTSRT